MSVTQKRLFSPSSMVSSQGWLVAILGRLFFRKVTFDETAVKKIRDAESAGRIVYVMNSHSFLDYMYFQWALSRNGLPLAGAATGINWFHAFFLRRFLTMIGILFEFAIGKLRSVRKGDESLKWTLHEGRAALVFMRRGRSVLPTAAEEYHDVFQQLIQIQKETEPSIILVPQFLLWKRTADRYNKSIVDMVFGHPDAPGRLRKFVNFVLNHRRAFVHVGDTLNLKDFIGESIEESESDERALAEKMRWRLHHQFALEYRVLKGPMIKDATRMRREILRHGEFIEEVHKTAKEEGKDPRAALKEVEKYLKEMAADFAMGLWKSCV